MRRIWALACFAVVIASGFSRTSVFSQTKPLRLYVFDGGVLESDPSRYRLTKEDVGTTQLSVAAYLIVHPQGVLLWDTGAVPDESWKPTGSPVEHKLVLPDGHDPHAAESAIDRERLFTGAGDASRAVALSLGSHRECQRVCARDVARASSRA